MVPASVDPASLTYGIQGPAPLGTGAAYRQPLFRADGGSRFVNVLTGIAVQSGGPGPIPTLPGFNFASAPFATGIVAPGEYNVGIACTRAGGTVLDKYWNVVMSFTADSADTPSGLRWTAPTVDPTTTTTVADTTTTTVASGGTTTTTVAGGTTTTTVAGGTTTTTVAGGSTSATITPSTPTPGGAYTVAFPNCSVGETITFQQAQSTPASVTAPCQAATALTSDGPTGFRRPLQAATGTATGSFTAAPTAPGTYTITMTGTVSEPRTVTFTIASTTSGGTGGGTGSNTATGGSPTGTGFGSTGTIPATGSSTTSLIVWSVLLLVFGRMAILLGRKPKVLTGT
ncbi:MAG TPA: hypothetical protein VK853_09665 [Ilumatobacteraceae bacterium]|nr:hypothetical protein [Ilumatobacteraceae bacterium]